MASLFFSASITLVLLSILPLSTAHPFDTDGDPIRNGKDYYIIPLRVIPLISTTTDDIHPSGLTYTQKHEECPLYIAQDKTENSPGTPVRISAPLMNFSSAVIGYKQFLHLAFKGPTPCEGSPLWRPTLDQSSRKFYITTGGEFDLPFIPPFYISERKTFWSPLYVLKLWPTKSQVDRLQVGLHEDGFLGLVKHSSPVVFKKAFNVTGLSTS